MTAPTARDAFIAVIGLASVGLAIDAQIPLTPAQQKKLAEAEKLIATLTKQLGGA